MAAAASTKEINHFSDVLKQDKHFKRTGFADAFRITQPDVNPRLNRRA
tara:strand:- start:398 stop:541 length:144 start_codon:yes stop_codon:yes gene_type:complete